MIFRFGLLFFGLWFLVLPIVIGTGGPTIKPVDNPAGFFVYKGISIKRMIFRLEYCFLGCGPWFFR